MRLIAQSHHRNEPNTHSNILIKRHISTPFMTVILLRLNSVIMPRLFQIVVTINSAYNQLFCTNHTKCRVLSSLCVICTSIRQCWFSESTSQPSVIFFVCLLVFLFFYTYAHWWCCCFWLSEKVFHNPLYLFK